MNFSGLTCAALFFASASAASLAQDVEVDCSGCKDHPMLARYPGAILFGADQKSFEEAQLPIGPVVQNEAGETVAPKTIKLTGKRTRLFYIAPAERSALEVFGNYVEALKKVGMTEVWTCSDTDCGAEFSNQAVQVMHLNLSNTPEASLGFVLSERPRYLLAKLARPQGDLHVMVMAADLTDKQRPAVYVMLIESKPMDTGLVTIAAGALDQNLMSTGKAVIYGITFDFDKSDIRPESKPQLDQIAKLLSEHPDLNLAITGHTDNQGNPDYNQKLSERRAQAIVASLGTTYGIAANRLSAQGMGSSSPIASNDAEEGRAKNRRVELVKR